MIENIVQTADSEFAAIIDGTQWFGITPASRFYAIVQAAIAAGATVTVQTDPLI